MSNSDYSFMKTGFDIVGDNELELKKNIAALVTLFGENAIRTSFIYVKHAKRKGVTVEDIKRAIMLECFFFTKRPDILTKMDEIKKAIFETDSESESESESDEENANEEEKFKVSECSCALCSCINKIYERWENWNPDTPMEKILKEHIATFGTSNE